MMCYKDMTFCDGNSGRCLKFNNGCERSLTENVKQDADRWWNSFGKHSEESPPIAKFVHPHELECYTDGHEDR